MMYVYIFSPDIPWPEGEESLSPEAQDAINALLTLDPAARPGARGNHCLTTLLELKVNKSEHIIYEMKNIFKNMKEWSRHSP